MRRVVEMSEHAEPQDKAKFDVLKRNFALLDATSTEVLHELHSMKIPKEWKWPELAPGAKEWLLNSVGNTTERSFASAADVKDAYPGPSLFLPASLNTRARPGADARALVDTLLGMEQGIVHTAGMFTAVSRAIAEMKQRPGLYTRMRDLSFCK